MSQLDLLLPPLPPTDATVFVDALLAHGWVLRGRRVRSCHMFSAPEYLDDLHRVAEQIGLRRAWFQRDHRVPHYDLTGSRRALAVELGAEELTSRQAVAFWHQHWPRKRLGRAASTE